MPIIVTKRSTTIKYKLSDIDFSSQSVTVTGKGNKVRLVPIGENTSNDLGRYLTLRKEFLDKKGEGIQHVMFGVNDFEREVAALTEKGASVVLKANMPGGRSIAYLDLNVGGLVVELVQNS